jgi:TPR repeat protein
MAQFNLGWMYTNGKGVPQDYSEAVKWFRKAAEQIDFEAMSNLGVAYENGQGVPQDYISAYMWYDLAAPGFKPAAEGRESLAKDMTSDDIEEAQKRGRACWKSKYKQCD